MPSAEIFECIAASRNKCAIERCYTERDHKPGALRSLESAADSGQIGSQLRTSIHSERVRF